MQLSLYIEISQPSIPTHFSIYKTTFLLITFTPKAQRMADQTISGNVIIGPHGGPGGDAWDDGNTYTGVRKIELSYKKAIRSFSVVYDKNGIPSPGPRHPSGDDTYTTVAIELDFPQEYITKVSGYTGVVPGASTQTEVVRSLTFSTNKRIYGPYGVEEGTPFSSPTISANAKIAGFFGRTSSDYLDAIGFYLSS